MILRHQLPAWSPLTLRALAAGIRPSADALSRLEQRVAAEYRSPSVFLTRSGTVALALAMLASPPPNLAQGRRPRIGLPAWGCFDLMTAADAADAEVDFYDIDPATLAPEPGSFGRMLAREPHAAVVAHWFGVPVDLRSLAERARVAGAFLIDDAAQAVGASSGGLPAGSGGDFGILSFGRGKGRTGGEGGALLVTSPRAEARLSVIAGKLAKPGLGLRAYAALWAQWALGRPSLYWLPASVPGLRLGETIYRPPPAIQSMATRSAAVLEATWQISLMEAEVRRANAARWQRALEAEPSLRTVTVQAGSMPGWLRYPIIPGAPNVSRFDGPSARRLGVLRSYPSPLVNLPVPVRRRAVSPEEFSGAQLLSERLFTLPTHGKLSRSDFETIRNAVADCCSATTDLAHNE